VLLLLSVCAPLICIGQQLRSDLQVSLNVPASVTASSSASYILLMDLFVGGPNASMAVAVTIAIPPQFVVVNVSPFYANVSVALVLFSTHRCTHPPTYIESGSH
jgi:hypothetical protein